ncbi:MAG: hypothetical protein Q7R77_02370 [Candidatus Daviesbacteria bacterium]|nr:hypothetical protein [Candidatus Daviesbacteria bacterium]
MPEKARVAIFEDNLMFLDAFKTRIIAAGHNVVSEATNLRTALEAVEQFEQLGVQVAIIDGNLDPNNTSGYDGRALVAAINRLAPIVKTVGMSNSSVEGVTIDLGKRNYPKLGETVTNL